MQPDPGEMQKQVELRAYKEVERVRQRLQQRKDVESKQYTFYLQSAGSRKITTAGAQSPVHGKDYKLYFVPPSRERVPFESPPVSHGKAHEKEYYYSKTLSMRLQQDLAKESENATFQPYISGFARTFQSSCTQEQIDYILLEKRMYRVANDVPAVSVPKPNQRPISERINDSIQQHVQKLREAKLPKEQELDYNCTFAPKISSVANPRRLGFYERLGDEAKRYQYKRASEIEYSRQEKQLCLQEEEQYILLAPVFFQEGRPPKRKDEEYVNRSQGKPLAPYGPQAGGTEMDQLLASVQRLEQMVNSVESVDYK